MGGAGAAPEEPLRAPAALPPPHPRLLQEAPRGSGQERRPPRPGAPGAGHPVTGASGTDIDTVHTQYFHILRIKRKYCLHVTVSESAKRRLLQGQ